VTVSTVVINMYDDPIGWPAHINKNVRDHSTNADPLIFQWTAFQEMKKLRFSFSRFHCKGNFQIGRVLKVIGLCTFSFLIKFIAFTANFLASKNTTSALLSTNGFNNFRILMRGYARMNIKWIVWKPHGVSGGYTKDFVMGRQFTKIMKKSSRF